MSAMSISMISRADDFGSAPSANAAILKGLESGCWIRNVSCMAPGLYLEQDAAQLVRYKDRVDFGLHFTVNSEWDALKWKPCCAAEQIPSLLDKTGNFYQSSPELQAAQPNVEELIAELDAQLEKLTGLGLPISYVDGHMFPERYIPGLDEAMREWCRRKGLLCTNSALSLWHGSPAFAETFPEYMDNVHTWLKTLPAGEDILYIMHPANLTPKTLLFANSNFPSGVVAHERELEAQSVIAPVWNSWAAELEIHLKRFSQVQLP